MIITFCTDNYFRWAVLFLRSWKATNDNNETIHISTLNFNQRQIDDLKTLYENLIISNENMDFRDHIEKLDMTPAEFDYARHGVKEGVRNVGKNRHIMNLFSVDKRVESIWRTVNKYKDEPYFIQTDIDLVFRKQLWPYLKAAVNKHGYDTGLRFKPDFENMERICKRINIGFMWLNNNKKSIKLVNDWYNIVNSVPNEERDIEDPNKNQWGQYTFYKAFEINRDDLKCFTISDSYFDAQHNEKSFVWSANRRIRGNKTNTYELLKQECCRICLK
jgi:hypothetical protein